VVSDADGTVLEWNCNFYLMEMGDIQMVEVGMSSLKSLQRRSKSDPFFHSLHSNKR
jgi:hypothetical protein